MAAVGNAYLTFPDLHTEVLVRILQHLGLGDLTRCTMVCSMLRHLITSDTILQYKMELERAGMVDGPANVPLTTKLERLRARNAAWNKGLIVYRGVIPDDSNLLSLHGGVGGVIYYYTHNPTEQGWSWILYRPAWPTHEGSSGLEPISVSPKKDGDVALTPLPLFLRGFNPEEELLILTRAKEPLHILLIDISRGRTIDTPWLTQLRFIDDMSTTACVDKVQSVGDLLLWSRVHHIYKEGRGEYRLVNWKTGAIVWRSLWEFSGACQLLDSSHVAVIDHRGVFVYQFDARGCLTNLPDWATEKSCSHSFAFPTFAADVDTISCYAPGSRYFRRDRPLFCDDPALTVLAVHVCCRISPTELEYLVLVVPIDTITPKLTSSPRSESHGQPEPRLIPWSEWGPDGAKLFKLLRKPSNISPWGSRVAITLWNSLGPEVYIVDVRPCGKEESFGRSGREISTFGGGGRVPFPFRSQGVPKVVVYAQDSSSELKSFAEPVTTRLPYRMTHIRADYTDDFEGVHRLDGCFTHDGIFSIMTF